MEQSPERNREGCGFHDWSVVANRTLVIQFRFKNLNDENAVGYCMMEDNNREFTIEVDRKLGIKELVTTICHEMIHVKQYEKEMDDWSGNGRRRWKGKTFNAGKPITTTFLGRKKRIVFKISMQTWYGMRRLYNDPGRQLYT